MTPADRTTNDCERPLQATFLSKQWPISTRLRREAVVALLILFGKE